MESALGLGCRREMTGAHRAAVELEVRDSASLERGQ